MELVLMFAGLAAGAAMSSSTVPQYFQTTPELYPGPTPTGQAAMLAQTNPAPFPSKSYIPPGPLETQVPIQHSPEDGNIFHMHGQLSHYFPNPVGFGVDEYPLPTGANITQLHMLSRHGARYPTEKPSVVDKLQNASFTADGPLAFLNDWTYKLGEQILVPVGKQELFDSGTLHQYLYGHLYPNNGTKIIARSTTEDRMTQSAEYFLSGFFGLDWPRNATLELIIEDGTFNNSLAGYDTCVNSDSYQSAGGDNASEVWQGHYLQDALKRLAPHLSFDDKDTNLTISDIYDLQSLCPYETVALGYSAFCPLFTYPEWQGYEYSIDLSFSGNNAFQSPTGRAVGIGWVQELRSRLQNRYLRKQGGSANLTLDTMPETFPLDQSLYLDFSHDTNIMSILTAMGLTQFNAVLPTDHMVEHELVVSHLEPFGARLDIEVIETARPLAAERPARYESGGRTTYLHMLLNQRTIPLGRSLKQCGERDDGWCEVGDFLRATDDAFERSMYERACFGDYESVEYGMIRDGNPVVSGGGGD